MEAIGPPLVLHTGLLLLEVPEGPVYPRRMMMYILMLIPFPLLVITYIFIQELHVKI